MLIWRTVEAVSWRELRPNERAFDISQSDLLQFIHDFFANHFEAEPEVVGPHLDGGLTVIVGFDSAGTAIEWDGAIAAAEKMNLMLTEQIQRAKDEGNG